MHMVLSPLKIKNAYGVIIRCHTCL